MERAQRYGDNRQLPPIPEYSTSKARRPHTLYDGVLTRTGSRQGKSAADAEPRLTGRQKKDPRGRKAASLPARAVHRYKLINYQELKPDDIIIAVMGASGCGKSSFISKATGYEGGVGHSLEPCTTKIHMIKVTSVGFNNPDIVLVDTPAFHDAQTHSKLLQSIGKHLTPSGSNARRHQLNGLLYFHRMTDNRIREGFPIHDLEHFPELTCSGIYRNITLVTTMWDSIDKNTGEKREEHLRRRYWKSMLDRRSGVVRFHNTRDSAWSILRPIIQSTREQREKAFNREVVLLHTQLRSTPSAKQAFTKTETDMEKSLERMMKICSDHHEVQRPEAMLKDTDMNGVRAIGGTILGALTCLGGRTFLMQ